MQKDGNAAAGRRASLYVVVALVFLSTLALGSFLIYLKERNQALQSQHSAMEAAAVHGHLLQQQLNRSLSATYALAAVLRQGKGRIDDFDVLAGEMLGLYGGISALQLAPDGIIARSVPLKGNEAAIGHNLLADPERNKEAFVALRTRQLTLAGPFTLRQGGVAVVGRLPIFLPDGQGGERFWGFATALIKITDLLAASELSATDAWEYHFQLSRRHPDTGQPDVFAASAAAPLDDPVSYRIAVPNGEWTLSLARIGGWRSSRAVIGIEAAIVLLMSTLAGLLVYNKLKQSDALRRSYEELKRVNRELEETHSQLLQAEKLAAIGQLAAGVAHEINNPIGFVNSNLCSLKRYFDDLLRLVAAYEQAEALLPADSPAAGAVATAKRRADLAYLKEDVAALLRESLDGVTRVRRIVQDLRDFSHVDNIDWEETDLHQGLDSTLNVVSNELRRKADVIKEYGTLPPVECMAAQINQVFMNLLVNAAQAIEHHGIITIRTGTAEQHVWIEIADTGRGIAAEHLPRIFEPFFTTKPVSKGAGLGLSISYGIVKNHGGSITVASAPGKGSAFRITLPRVRAATCPDAPTCA